MCTQVFQYADTKKLIPNRSRNSMVQESRDEGVKTVVIVGAGAAGLQSANILLESDAYLSGRLKILVLEAKDRVGGRISIDKRWGIPFDCGML